MNNYSDLTENRDFRDKTKEKVGPRYDLEVVPNHHTKPRDQSYPVDNKKKNTISMKFSTNSTSTRYSNTTSLYSRGYYSNGNQMNYVTYTEPSFGQLSYVTYTEPSYYTTNITSTNTDFPNSENRVWAFTTEDLGITTLVQNYTNSQPSYWNGINATVWSDFSNSTTNFEYIPIPELINRNPLKELRTIEEYQKGNRRNKKSALVDLKNSNRFNKKESRAENISKFSKTSAKRSMKLFKEDSYGDDLWVYAIDIEAKDYYANRNTVNCTKKLLECDEEATPYFILQNHITSRDYEYEVQKSIPWVYKKGEKNPINTWDLDDEFEDADIEMPKDGYFLNHAGRPIQIGLN